MRYRKGAYQDRHRQTSGTGRCGCSFLGDTRYYSQFGFAKAPDMAPAGVPKEHFMVLCLGSDTPECVINFHEVFRQEEQEPRHTGSAIFHRGARGPILKR